MVPLPGERIPWAAKAWQSVLIQYPLVNYGKSPFLMGKSAINGDFP